MILTRYLGTFETLGTGPNRFRGTNNAGTIWLSLWNNGNGAAAGSQLNLGNDLSEIQSAILMLSSGYSTSGSHVANSMVLVSNGTGGLNFNAVNGSMRYYAGGSLRYTLDGTGHVFENNHGVRIKNTGGIAIDGVALSSGNNMTVGSDNPSNVGNTTISAGFGILFRNQNVSRMELSSAGHLLATAATQHLGASSQRWGTAFVTAVDTGDITFDNKFKLTEHDKVGIKVPGMALCNEHGEIIAFFDRKGTVYARVYAKLPELYEANRREP